MPYDTDMNGTLTAPAETPRARPSQHRVQRTVAVVSRRLEQHALEIAVRAVPHDIVFVESVEHAYSRIKQALPDRVIVFMTHDELDSCRLFTLLALDCDTARIPAVMHVVTAPAETGTDDDDGLEPCGHVVRTSLH